MLCIFTGEIKKELLPNNGNLFVLERIPNKGEFC